MKGSKIASVVAFLTLGLSIAASAQQVSVPNSSELNYGSVYCLPTSNLNGFNSLTIFGQSFDIANQTGSPNAPVKWTVWKGPSFDSPNMIKIFTATGSIPDPVHGSNTVSVVNTDAANPYTQACIHNVIPPSSGGTGNVVVFQLSQTPQ